LSKEFKSLPVELFFDQKAGGDDEPGRLLNDSAPSIKRLDKRRHRMLGNLFWRWHLSFCDVVHQSAAGAIAE
jgi:hypothetical protein